MPRAKIPEYFKEYKVTCTGVGRTVQEAEHHLKENVKYNLKWIRGAVIQAKRWGDNNNTEGSNIVRNLDLVFKNRAYLRDKSREMTYREIWEMPTK